MRPRFLRVEFRVAFTDHATLNACLEALVRQNLWQHDQLAAAGRGLPPLYQSRVVYRRDPPGAREWFRSLARVYTTGWGDCDDLASIRAAELRRHGVHALAEVRRTPAPNTLHAVVTDGRNIIEDPCAVLAALGRYDA